MKDSMIMSHHIVREATMDDLHFLKRMLYEAVFWDPLAERTSFDELFAVPEIAILLDQWKKRNGDFGLIAENEKQESVAAVWYRYATIDTPSFGFIDEQTPEIGIAVLAKYRSKGLGRNLMNQILAHAKHEDIKQISLSVDPNNFALSLYRTLGFLKVAESGSSWTMVKKL